MSTRHEAREWAVQFLFQRDFNAGDLDEALTDFWEGRKPSAKSKAFVEEIVRGVEAHLDELDRVLQKYTEHWDVKRMSAVDRNIMRMALYEMLHRQDIPPVVSINEAVELAKDFSGREAGRFVNGVLDQACQHLDRPSREAAPASDAEPGEGA